LKTYEELAVLEQGDDGAIVSIRGEEGPLVLLGPSYLGHLKALVDRAQHAVGSFPVGTKSEPIVALCTEMQTLLKTYDETCNKYLGSPPAVRTIAEIEDEMEQLRKELERY
jgi:hypothetical protein